MSDFLLFLRCLSEFDSVHVSIKWTSVWIGFTTMALLSLNSRKSFSSKSDSLKRGSEKALSTASKNR